MSLPNRTAPSSKSTPPAAYSAEHGGWYRQSSNNFVGGNLTTAQTVQCRTGSVGSRAVSSFPVTPPRNTSTVSRGPVGQQSSGSTTAVTRSAFRFWNSSSQQKRAPQIRLDPFLGRADDITPPPAVATSTTYWTNSEVKLRAFSAGLKAAYSHSQKEPPIPKQVSQACRPIRIWSWHRGLADGAIQSYDMTDNQVAEFIRGLDA